MKYCCEIYFTISLIFHNIVHFIVQHQFADSASGTELQVNTVTARRRAGARPLAPPGRRRRVTSPLSAGPECHSGCGQCQRRDSQPEQPETRRRPPGPGPGRPGRSGAAEPGGARGRRQETGRTTRTRRRSRSLAGWRHRDRGSGSATATEWPGGPRRPEPGPTVQLERERPVTAQRPPRRPLPGAAGPRLIMTR